MRALFKLWPKFLRAAIFGPLFSIPISVVMILSLMTVENANLNNSVVLFGVLFVLGALFYSFIVNLVIGIPLFILLLKFNRLNYMYTTILSVVVVSLPILLVSSVSEYSLNKAIYTCLFMCSYGVVVSSTSLYFSGLRRVT